MEKKQPVGLPDPTKTTELSEAAATASANREVNRIYESSVTVNVHSESTTLPSVRAKQGSYHAFTDEIRAKIGRHALEHGSTCAVKHFAKELIFIDSIDSQVQVYLRKLPLSGIVNRTVTLAAAKGIILSRAPHLYKDNLLGRKWAESLLNHMGYVKRKGTKEARKILADFDEIKSEFLNRVSNACQEDSVTDNRMIINFDQTGTKFVPTSEWTMESQGSKQVPIKGNEDKREMTVLLSCNMKGEMLLAQLIYQGNASVMNNSNSKINNNTNFTSTLLSILLVDTNNKVLLVMIFVYI